MKREGGFTIIELLMVISLTALLTSLIMVFTMTYWRYGYMLEADLATMTTRLNAGDYMRDAIGTSTGLIIQNGIADPHPNAPDPSKPANYWLPIHAIPKQVTMGNATSATPLVYFRQPSITANGSFIMNGTQPYEDEYVLYLDGASKSLKQRTLANPGASGNRVKTSCPPASASTLCPADKVIATDIASIATRYFSRTGNLIDYTSIWDSGTNSYAGPDFPAVEVVEFTLNLSKKPLLQRTNTSTNTTIIRIALRNA